MTKIHKSDRDKIREDLRQLPKFKFQLKEFQHRLKHLETVKDTVSENIYEKLHQRYTEKIDDLSMQIEKLQAEGEEQQSEKEVERSYLQTKQEECATELREIQTAYEQGKLSEEDFQKARTRLNRHRRRFRKNQQRIERELAALRFYLTFEGEESYHHEQFEQTLNSVKSKTLSTLSSIIEKSYSNLLMRQKMKDFFGFRKMVSTAIIKFIYILGVIVLTIGGIVMSFQIPGIPGAVKILIGLGTIILGNLLWRIICEAWILVFSIHDILGSVEKILKEK